MKTMLLLAVVLGEGEDRRVFEGTADLTDLPRVFRLQLAMQLLTNALVIAAPKADAGTDKSGATR